MVREEKEKKKNEKKREEERVNSTGPVLRSQTTSKSKVMNQLYNESSSESGSEDQEGQSHTKGLGEDKAETKEKDKIVKEVEGEMKVGDETKGKDDEDRDVIDGKKVSKREKAVVKEGIKRWKMNRRMRKRKKMNMKRRKRMLEIIREIKREMEAEKEVKMSGTIKW